MTEIERNSRHPPDHTEGSDDQVKRRLRRKLRSLWASTDLLNDLMGFGHFEEMAMTRDGLLVGRPRRSVGFDAFIGSVTSSMRQRTSRLWCELDHEECQLVLRRLAAQQIDPRRVGIPVAPTSNPAPSLGPLLEIRGT